MRNLNTKIVELLWLVIVVGLFVASIWLLKNGQLEENLARFGIWAPVTVVILKASTLVIAPLGGTPLYVVSGALFGNLYGFLVSIAGDIVGSTICFVLGRRYGEKIVKRFTGEKYFSEIEKVVGLLGKTGSLVKARVGLISIPEILSYAAGLSRVSFWKFTLVNTLFYIPVDLALVFLGSQIRDLSLQYFFLLPLVALLFAAIGFGLFYKDYKTPPA